MSRWFASFLLVPSIVFAVFASAASPKSVVFPEGYRGWTHVKSMWIGADHALANPFAGLHHVYVNDTGRSAMEAGKPMPDGTVLVFDLLDGGVTDAAIAEGPRKLVGVMRKDRAAYPSTGGWGFEAFAGDSKTSRLVTDGGASCFTCHQSRQGADFVFTTWRP